MGTDWTTVSNTDDPEEGFGEWTISASLDSKAERDAWCFVPTALGVSANAAVSERAPTWGNWAAENFRFTPEEVEIEPELTQADAEDWTIVEFED